MSAIGKPKVHARLGVEPEAPGLEAEAEGEVRQLRARDAIVGGHDEAASEPDEGVPDRRFIGQMMAELRHEGSEAWLIAAALEGYLVPGGIDGQPLNGTEPVVQREQQHEGCDACPAVQRQRSQLLEWP